MFSQRTSFSNNGIIGLTGLAGLALLILAHPAFSGTLLLQSTVGFSGSGSGPAAQATYQSGSGLSYNGVGVLTNMPDPMPLGLNSATLDLTAYEGESYSNFDVASGGFHFFDNTTSTNPGSATLAESLVSFEDGGTFSFSGLPPGASVTVGWGLTVEGTCSFPLAPEGTIFESVGWSVGSAVSSWDGECSGAGSIAGSFPGIGFTSYSLQNLTSYSFQLEGFTTVTNGQHVFEGLQYSLSSSGALANFRDTVQLSLQLPPGVTFTPDDGVFLTGTVPEPATMLLVGAAFCIASLVRRKRGSPSPGSVDTHFEA